MIDGEMSDPATRAELEAYLLRVWHRADGRPFEIKAVCHDSGGHHTDAVYAFSKANIGRRWYAVKGESARTGFRNPVWLVKRPSSRTKKSFRPIMLGVNAAKDFIRQALHREKPGAGFMHFNSDWDLGAFAQLTAERIQIEGEGAFKIRKWVPIAGRANERLDCRVYALAALRGLIHMGVKLNRVADEVGAAITCAPEAERQEEDEDMPAPIEQPSRRAAEQPSVKPTTPPSSPPTAVAASKKPRTGFTRRLA